MSDLTERTLKAGYDIQAKQDARIRELETELAICKGREEGKQLVINQLQSDLVTAHSLLAQWKHNCTGMHGSQNPCGLTESYLETSKQPVPYAAHAPDCDLRVYGQDVCISCTCGVYDSASETKANEVCPTCGRAGQWTSCSNIWHVKDSAMNRQEKL